VKEIVLMPFRPSGQPPWYGTMGYLVAVLAVAVATGVLWIAQPVLNLGSIYLVYLVAVVMIATGWGWRQGFLAAVLAFLAANFFFIPPRFTFTIAEPQDVLALVIFLGIATLTSQLVARLRQEANDARRSEQITNILYNLSQSINRQHNLPALLQDVAEQLCGALGLRACTISLEGVEGLGSVTGHSGSLLNSDMVSANILETVLLSGGRSAGVLLIELPEGKRGLSVAERRITTAFADQLTVAFERYEGQQAAIQAEVLRRTDALRAALLSTVAHDLRTPLGSIKAAATSLLDPPVEWPEEDEREFLKTIVGEVDRINRLVTNLLDMARIEAGQLRPHKEPRRIREVIETVLERLGPMLERHPIQTRIERSLPTVKMDPVEIDEVLTNLIENAIKYTPQGTPLEVSAEKAGDFLEIAVADRGPGISPDKMSHLFDRFYRVTSGAARGVTGTGLGLAIVKGIVEAHSGQVTAENRVGGGMVFRFTLPIQPPEQQDGVTGSANNSEAESTTVGPPVVSTR
jgi:two-component system sensor histidine kinase KdpD